MKRQQMFSLFKLSLTYTLAGTAFFLLAVDISHLLSGKLIRSDLTLLPFTFVFLCLIFFVPVFLGIIILQLFLRHQFRKGWLTPRSGILSGIVIWGLAGISLCLFLVVLHRLPVDEHLRTLASFRPYDLLVLISDLLKEPSLLLGIATACLEGGWLGHLISHHITSDQISQSSAAQPSFPRER